MGVSRAYPPPDRPPVSVDRPPGGWNPLRLAVGGGAFAGVLVASLLVRGVPLEREQVLAWVMAALGVLAFAGPKRRLVQVVTDWLPFLGVLVIYDYSRGWASRAGFSLQWTPQLEADRLLFGGHVPAVWLQERFLDVRSVQWWEVLTSAIYMSHFIVPFVVAAVLWVRDRHRWLGFVRRFVTLSFLGVATFIVFPAAPPWLASRHGYIEAPVVRPLGRGWSLVGLDVAERVISKGQGAVNLTAAIPSLHAAYAALVAAVLWSTVGRLARAVLAAYVVAMGATLVFGGEHYVVDVLVGWLYVAITMWLVSWVERWWHRRRGVLSPEPVRSNGP